MDGNSFAPMSLHFIPFGALLSKRGYVVEEFFLRTLPSVSVLRFFNTPVKADHDTILALGDPDIGDPNLRLPYAKKEVLGITRGRPGAQVFFGKEATETALRKLGSRFETIYIASHGIFDPVRPLDSRLLLAPDDKHDGDLTVSKLYEMQIKNDIVVLFACETGIGKVLSGDDVLGISCGFLYAGTRSIVSSPWRVDDQVTQSLMEAFYRGFNIHGDKRRALAEAKREMLRNSQTSHPYFWAAFQLTGAVR